MHLQSFRYCYVSFIEIYSNLFFISYILKSISPWPHQHNALLGFWSFSNLIGENGISVQFEFSFLFLWMRFKVFSFKPAVISFCEVFFHIFCLFSFWFIFLYWFLGALYIIDKFSPLSMMWVTNISPVCFWFCFKCFFAA